MQVCHPPAVNRVTGISALLATWSQKVCGSSGAVLFSCRMACRTVLGLSYLQGCSELPLVPPFGLRSLPQRTKGLASASGVAFHLPSV